MGLFWKTCAERKQLAEELIDFFDEFVCPYADIMTNRNSIIQFYTKGSSELFLLPAIKRELGL